MSSLVIASRFCGPDQSGNGGYVSGLLAEELGACVEVTLRAPPPLDRPLTLEGGDPLRLLDGETLVAEARTGTLELEPPAPPSFDAARGYEARYAGHRGHAFPRCFVCGPQRVAGDGLRIFAGPSEDHRLVAATWTPDASLSSADGTKVRPRYVWAALDCPGYFGAVEGAAALLGRMTADLRADVLPGQPHVVVGWKLGEEGRKRFAGTAIFDRSGRCLAKAKQVWIVPA